LDDGRQADALGGGWPWAASAASDATFLNIMKSTAIANPD
jgi:hypothetical protein